MLADESLALCMYENKRSWMMYLVVKEAQGSARSPQDMLLHDESFLRTCGNLSPVALRNHKQT